MTKRFHPNLQLCLVPPSATIRDALMAISSGGALMACVVDCDLILKGIITDSDVRRAILKGISLESAALEIAVKSPTTAEISSSTDELAAIAADAGVREIPLLDQSGKICDIFVLLSYDVRVNFDGSTMSEKPPLPNPMLILAGGKGTRLRSVVNDRPKPLAIIGGKPLLQTLLERARNSGIRRFIVAVNYLADQVVNHLELPQYDGLDIKYVREKEFLGTAGALGLISEQWDMPILVANGDVLTSIPFEAVLHHHDTSEADITCVVRPFHLTVPFGVVEIQQDRIVEVREKPTHHHLVNAGIYVVSPAIKRMIEPDKFLDMPALVSRAIEEGYKVLPFLMHEYWLDVGKPEDFAKANEEFDHVFGS